MNLLALVGHPASGKSTLAKKLAQNDKAILFSGSELLRRSVDQLPAEEKPKLLSRSDMNIYHIQWRVQNGLSAMGYQAFELSQKLSPTIVCFENLRNYHDAKLIQEKGGIIISLQCPIDIRFNRALLANRGLDSKTIEEFLNAEKEEYNSPSPYGSHVDKIMSESTIQINSSLPVEEVYKQLRYILSGL